MATAVLIVPIKCSLTEGCTGVLQYTGRQDEGGKLILQCTVCGKQTKD